MNTIGWQHAKVKSTKRNPPQKSVLKCHNAKGYTFKIWKSYPALCLRPFGSDFWGGLKQQAKQNKCCSNLRHLYSKINVGERTFLPNWGSEEDFLDIMRLLTFQFDRETGERGSTRCHFWIWVYETLRHKKTDPWDNVLSTLAAWCIGMMNAGLLLVRLDNTVFSLVNLE